MKKILMLISTLFLCACTTHGKVSYSLVPVLDAEGEVVTYEVHVKNSKDYDSLKLHLTKGGDGSIDLTLDEVGVSASDPATAAMHGQAKLIDALSRTLSLLPIPGGSVLSQDTSK